MKPQLDEQLLTVGHMLLHCELTLGEREKLWKKLDRSTKYTSLTRHDLERLVLWNDITDDQLRKQMKGGKKDKQRAQDKQDAVNYIIQQAMKYLWVDRQR